MTTTYCHIVPYNSKNFGRWNKKCHKKNKVSDLILVHGKKITEKKNIIENKRNDFTNNNR